jgi:hypothetical protein
MAEAGWTPSANNDLHGFQRSLEYESALAVTRWEAMTLGRLVQRLASRSNTNEIDMSSGVFGKSSIYDGHADFTLSAFCPLNLLALFNLFVNAKPAGRYALVVPSI